MVKSKPPKTPPMALPNDPNSTHLARPLPAKPPTKPPAVTKSPELRNADAPKENAQRSRKLTQQIQMIHRKRMVEIGEIDR